MTTFDKRKDAFENKFAHDAEMRFKAEARCNKLVGLWAASLLGKTGAEADAYAKSVVAADFEEAGDEDVFRKIRQDLDAAGIQQSDHQIRRTMDEMMSTAIDQISKGRFSTLSVAGSYWITWQTSLCAITLPGVSAMSRPTANFVISVCRRRSSP